MYLSEDRLVKKSSGPETFKIDLDNSLNLIVTLRTYIQGQKSLRDASPSGPIKAPKKVSKVQSRPTKRKISQMSNSDSSSSTKDEETRATPGAELASGVLSSEQNKIMRELMQRKLLVRKGHVFNLPITHIHRPLVDEKIGRRLLEIREPVTMVGIYVGSGSEWQCVESKLN